MFTDTPEPLKATFIQNQLNEVQKELAAIPEFHKLWSPSQKPVKIFKNYTFFNFHLNPLSILDGTQDYSTERFINDGLILFNYFGKQVDSEREKRKEKLIVSLNETCNLIKENNKFNITNDYIELCNDRKEWLPDENEPKLLQIQQLISNMFLLKAHYLKYQLLNEYGIIETTEGVPEMMLLLNDYNRFLELKERDLKAALKYIKEYENYDDKMNDKFCRQN